MIDFYEDDEWAADVAAAYERTRAGVTVCNGRSATVWACEHMTATGSLTRGWCWYGCEMEAVE